MNFTLTKKPVKCADTGVLIDKHEGCLFDPGTNRYYSQRSELYRKELNSAFAKMRKQKRNKKANFSHS